LPAVEFGAVVSQSDADAPGHFTRAASRV
jgi:hypothetical protein